MEVQEIAFMVNLIKSRYRREMGYFLTNSLVGIISVAALGFQNYGLLHLELGEGMLLFIMVIAILMVFAFKWGDSSLAENNFPWTVKRKQKKALEDATEAHVKFDELPDIAELQEYFVV